eukprot:9376624-Pyramimonas_sp.AAC.2
MGGGRMGPPREFGTPLPPTLLRPPLELFPYQLPYLYITYPLPHTPSLSPTLILYLYTLPLAPTPMHPTPTCILVLGKVAILWHFPRADRRPIGIAPSLVLFFTRTRMGLGPSAYLFRPTQVMNIIDGDSVTAQLMLGDLNQLKEDMGQSFEKKVLKAYADLHNPIEDVSNAIKKLHKHAKIDRDDKAGSAGK